MSDHAQETLLQKIEAEARRFAGMYQPFSDGRNTFVIFADWIAALAGEATSSDRSQAKEPEASGGLCAIAPHAVRVGEPTRIGAVVGDQEAAEPSSIQDSSRPPSPLPDDIVAVPSMSDDALTELATEWEKMGVILRKTAERTISDSDIAAAEAYETCAKYLREVLAAACPLKALGWSDAFDVAQRGFDAWAAKDHNRKWVKLIDGTPIQNDLLVNIAEAFSRGN